MRGILEKDRRQRSYSVYILKVELKGSVEELGVRCEKKRGVMFTFLVAHVTSAVKMWSVSSCTSILFGTKTFPGCSQQISPWILLAVIGRVFLL